VCLIHTAGMCAADRARRHVRVSSVGQEQHRLRRPGERVAVDDRRKWVDDVIRGVTWPEMTALSPTVVRIAAKIWNEIIVQIYDDIKENVLQYLHYIGVWTYTTDFVLLMYFFCYSTLFIFVFLRVTYFCLMSHCWTSTFSMQLILSPRNKWDTIDKWRAQTKSGPSHKNKFPRKSCQKCGLSSLFHWCLQLLARNGRCSIECEYICGAVPAGAPLNFTAIGVSSTSVHLQWDQPARQHRNGEIVLYELLYHDRRNPADEWPTNTTETSIIIDGLQPTTNYIFQIRAYTGKGAGPWSNQLPFQTFAAQRACS